MALVVKNSPANAGVLRDVGSIPGLERSPGGEMADHPSILAWRIPWTESWQATAHGVAESQKQLKRLTYTVLSPIPPLLKSYSFLKKCL